MSKTSDQVIYVDLPWDTQEVGSVRLGERVARQFCEGRGVAFNIKVGRRRERPVAAGVKILNLATGRARTVFRCKPAR